MKDRTEYFRQYREEHQSEQRRYYVEHCEEIKERSRQRHAANREECRERSRQYYIEHRREMKEHSSKNYYNHGGQPMTDNRSCSLFLGVCVAERLLSHLFKNVTCMPNNNPGFDFRCGKGYLVDVKSGCIRISSTGTIYWQFTIKRNTIADYFLCIAFDNRRDLNPLHHWLIPGDVLSHLMNATISETTLAKWAEYEKPIDAAISCCDAIKEAI